jgi:hypothetical protein
MIEFKTKNYFLSQLFGTIYYASLATLAVFSCLELAKRGFVSYNFNLVWLLMAVLASGSLHSVFKAGPNRNGVFSKLVFLGVLFFLFFIFGAQIKIQFLNPYLLSVFLIINLGLAWYLLRPSKED